MKNGEGSEGGGMDNVKNKIETVKKEEVITPELAYKKAQLERFKGIIQRLEETDHEIRSDYIQEIELLPEYIHSDLALLFINSGYSGFVAYNLGSFRNLNAEVAAKLVEHEDINIANKVRQNLNVFTSMSKETIFGILKKEPGALFPCYYDDKKDELPFSKFGAFDLDKDMAEEMIDKGLSEVVAMYPDRFAGLKLDNNLVIRLIKGGADVGDVIYHLDLYHDVDRGAVAKMALDKNDIGSVLYNLEVFTNLEKSIGLKLLDYIGDLEVDMATNNPDHNAREVFAEHLDVFSGLDREVAEKMVEAGLAECVLSNHEKFSGLTLDLNLAILFVDKGRARILASKIEMFPTDSRAPIADYIFKSGDYPSLAENLDKFPGIDNKQLLQKLVENERMEYYAEENIEKFSGLDREALDKFIDVRPRRGYSYIIENPDKFNMNGLDDDLIESIIKTGRAGDDLVAHLDKFFSYGLSKMAYGLIDARDGESVMSNLDRFPGLDMIEVAKRLIGSGQIKTFIENFEKFNGIIFGDEIAENILDECEKESYQLRIDSMNDFILNNLKSFNGLSKKTAIRVLTNYGKRSYDWDNRSKNKGPDRDVLLKEIDRFVGIDKEFALTLLKNYESEFVFQNAGKFAGFELNEELANDLIDQGEGRLVAEHLDRFKNADHDKVAKRLIAAGASSGLMSHIDKFQLLSSEVALDLITSKNSKERHYGSDYLVDRRELLGFLFKNLEKFDGLQIDKDLADLLIENDCAEYVARNIGRFPESCHKDLADQLIDMGEGTAVVEHLEEFVGLDINNVFGRLLLAKKWNHNNFKPKSLVLTADLDKFPGLDHKEVAERMIISGLGRGVARNLESFKGIDHQDLAWRLVDTGYSEDVVENLENFVGMDYPKLAKKIVEFTGDATLLRRGFGHWRDLDSDIAFALLDTSDAWLVLEYPDAFKSFVLDSNIAKRLIESGNIIYVKRYVDKFIGLDDEAIQLLIENNYVAEAGLANDKLAKPNRALSIAYDLLGDGLMAASYLDIDMVINNRADSACLQRLAISHSGEQGLREIRANVKKFKDTLLAPDFDPNVYAGKAFFEQYLMQYTRFQVSSWGDHEVKKFRESAKDFASVRRNNEIKGLNSAFTESGTIEIDKIDKKKQDAFEFSQSFISRYGTMARSIGSALELLADSHPLTKIADNIKGKMKIILDEIDRKKAATSNDRALENLDRQYRTLSNINLRSVSEFQENFSKLAEFKEIYDDLRQMIFYMALHKHRAEREKAEAVARIESPVFDDISWMLNFIEHIVNKETWKEYFTDKEAVKKFRGLINVKAISEEYARAQNQSTKGTAFIDFIPTRGWLLEMSGHIADACWASKYYSVAKEFPNISAVIMVQNRGTKSERLAGACMLIESEAEDGTPLLICRGLNPIENVINGLSVSDFCDKYFSYIGGLAKKCGRKPAIVADTSGGASTNRPALAIYLDKLKPDFERVKLASKNDTAFNGYDIDKSTYLIGETKFAKE